MAVEPRTAWLRWKHLPIIITATLVIFVLWYRIWNWMPPVQITSRWRIFVLGFVTMAFALVIYAFTFSPRRASMRQSIWRKLPLRSVVAPLHGNPPGQS